MHKHLYDIFAHWYYNSPVQAGQVYLYSDPHFNDSESDKLRAAHGVAISDSEQIARINRKVSVHDTLIILGDIGDPSYLRKLKAGRKILILGNHDRGATKYQNYVDEIYEGILMISPKIVLSHEPVDIPYALNIHGHTHAITCPLIRPFNIRKYISDPLYHGEDERHIDITAEKVDYTPVSLKEIVNSGILKNVPDIHRETINTAVATKAQHSVNSSTPVEDIKNIE